MTTIYHNPRCSKSRQTLALLEENNVEAAKKSLKEAETVIAKVASKGVLHSRSASRKISGLARKVHQMSAAG